MAKTLFEVTDSLFSDCRNALDINNNNLKKLMLDNKDTDYGKKMGFSDIMTPEEYKKRVPVTDFTQYEGKICSPNAFTAYPIFATLTSSGTTGKQKLFPITEESLSRYSSYLHDVQYCFSKIKGKRFSVSFHHPPREGATIFSYAYYFWLDENGLLDYDLFFGGRDFLICDEDANIPYVKIWMLFACPELEAIQASYLYEMATVFQYMEDNWQLILNDMKNNVISADLSDKYKALLLKYRPSDERINELEEILKNGFDSEPVARRMWKNLKMVGGIGGKMYSFQEKQLRRYVGDIPTYYYTYTCSECVMGAPVMDMPLYVLLPKSAYYEFIPAECDDDTTVDIEDLELGKEYEPVITNFSGMYRYRVNDIIKIRSFIYDSPVFEVVRRRKYLLDVTGEKLDAEKLIAAVSKLAEKCNINITDFAVCADSKRARSRYILFIECDEGYVDIDSAAFDEILKENSFDYEDIRNLGWLSRPAVYAVNHGDIAMSHTIEQSMSHKKPHIFISDEQREFLTERNKAYATENKKIK